MNNTIYFSKLRPDAIIPSKRDEDGAYDIYACFDESIMKIEPHEIVKVPTGIASAFDKKYRIVFQERGSTADIGLKIDAGLIDSGFRGEWKVFLHNLNGKTIYITKEYNKITEFYQYICYPYTKAICQAKIQAVPVVAISEIPYEKLLQFKSERGTGMLGSSNK
jgi:dUTP pyrophosphatase